ncbi:MAG: hypothetical protein V3V08_23740 [Nannocystaceae bacterium]
MQPNGLRPLHCLASAFWASTLTCSPPSGDGAGEAGTGARTSSGSDPTPDSRATDLRDNAPVVGVGRWPGNLSGFHGEGGGACGLGGPDAFLRVKIALRADAVIFAHGTGFVPRLHAALYGGADLPIRPSPCAHGLPLTLPDMPAGAEVTLVVGIDPEAPAANLTGAASQDALEFAVDVSLREILGVGARCEPDARSSRCVGGSRCLAGADPAAAAWTCQATAGDTCDAPIDVHLPAQTGVTIGARELLSDAHHHSCTGTRTVERVYRLHLAADLSPAASVRITSTVLPVGLAVRSPGCAPAHEVTCIAPEAESGPVSASFVVGELAQLAVSPYLFVELPSLPSERAAPEGPTSRGPHDIRFEIVDG